MIVFRNQENRKRLENHEKSGKIIRLMPGVYSTDLSSDHAIQVRLYFLKILTYLRPGSIISHRSAIKQDFGIADGVIIVTDPGINDNYVHDLPGLKILVSPGHKRLPSDPDLGGVFISSAERAVLENLETRRIVKSVGISKQADQEDLLLFLSNRLHGNISIKGFLDAAKFVSTQSSNRWTDELTRLEKILNDRRDYSSIQDTVDLHRIKLFEELSIRLLQKTAGNAKYHGDLLPDFPSTPSSDDRRFLNLAYRRNGVHPGGRTQHRKRLWRFAWAHQGWARHSCSVPAVFRSRRVFDGRPECSGIHRKSQALAFHIWGY